MSTWSPDFATINPYEGRNRLGGESSAHPTHSTQFDVKNVNYTPALNSSRTFTPTQIVVDPISTITDRVVDPVVAPVDPTPTQHDDNMEHVYKARGDLMDYGDGKSPVDELIQNRSLTGFDASAATTSLAQAQRIAQNPNLTEGAKQAAVAELNRRIGIDRSNLVGSLTEAAQERAYQATRDYANYSMEVALNDWAITRGMSEEERRELMFNLEMEQEYADTSYLRVVGWRESKPDATSDQVLSHVMNDPLIMESLTNWYQSTGAEGVPPEEWVASAISNMNTSSENRRTEMEQQFRTFTDDPEFLEMLMTPEMMTLLEYGTPMSKGDGTVDIQFGDNDILRIGKDTEGNPVYEIVDNEGNPINPFGENDETGSIVPEGYEPGEKYTDENDGKQYIVDEQGKPQLLPVSMSDDEILAVLRSDERWDSTDPKYASITTNPHLVADIIKKHKGDYDEFGYEQFIESAKKEANYLVDSISIDESGRVTGSITPEQSKNLSHLVPLLRDEGSDFVVSPTSTKYATEGAHLTYYNGSTLRRDTYYSLNESTVNWVKENRGKLYEQDGRVYIVGGVNMNASGGQETDYIELFDLETGEVKKIGRGSHNGKYRSHTTSPSDRTLY